VLELHMPLNCPFTLEQSSYCWTAYYWTHELLRAPGPDVKCPRVNRKEITDCACWSVTVDSYCGKTNRQRASYPR
jgi:hypothetical protein